MLRVPLAEIAADLGCSPGKVYGYLEAGLVPHHKRGNRYVVLRPEYERWKAEGARPAPPPAPPGPAVPSIDPSGLLRLLEGREIEVDVAGLRIRARLLPRTD